jgi:hypothetical protein
MGQTWIYSPENVLEVVPVLRFSIVFAGERTKNSLEVSAGPSRRFIRKQNDGEIICEIPRGYRTADDEPMSGSPFVAMSAMQSSDFVRNHSTGGPRNECGYDLTENDSISSPT